MLSSTFNRLTIVILATLCNSVPANPVLADEPTTVVTVHLMNGRKSIGLVDADSDTHNLVIRRTSENVVLRTRVPWTSVAFVTADEFSFSTEQMKSQVVQLSSIGQKSAFDGNSGITTSNQYPVKGKTSTLQSPGGLIELTASGEPDTATIAGPVKSLQLVTQLANWDNDAEIDGLLVRILPLDQFGQLVPVNGQLNLKLLGVSRTLGGQAQPGRSPVEFPELTTWTQVVRRTDFTPEGAVYRLEFRNFHPERDLAIDPLGMVSGRLVVPGTGTFAASEGLTVLRPYNPTRDFHQMFRGTRTVPGEVRD